MARLAGAAAVVVLLAAAGVVVADEAPPQCHSRRFRGAQAAGAAGGPSTAALAMQGGGFRALAADAGLFAGLLATRGRQAGNRTPVLLESGLMDRFCLLSTVSGSSWFMSELVYSQPFLQLLQEMAQDPWTASGKFRKGWTNKFLFATRIDVPTFDFMAELARLIVRWALGSADEDTILMARFLFATGITWTNFVDTILNSTAGIDESVRLGSPVNDWAAGHIWMADHSAVMPSTGGNKTARFYQEPLGSEGAGYQVSGVTLGSAMVDYQPARFSIVLGAGENSAAPLPYLPAKALPLLTRFAYQGRVNESDKEPITVSSGLLGGSDLAHGTLERDMGLLPVSRVVGASSAFVGNTLMLGPLAAEGVTILKAQLTPWISSVGGGMAFEAADDLVAVLRGGVTKEVLQGLADSAVRGIIDGGFTDGTGIAQSVAAGADEVVVILNSNATNNPYYVEALFNNGPTPLIPGKPAALFPVFQQPSSREVVEAFAMFHRLRLPQDVKFLRTLAVGTIQAVTATNKFWGLEGGRDVTIHVINIGSELRIGLLQDFDSYNVLAQEIATTMMDLSNIVFVEQVLLPIFLGPNSTGVRPQELFVV